LDLRWLLQNLPVALRTFIETAWTERREQYIIAGGFIRGVIAQEEFQSSAGRKAGCNGGCYDHGGVW
jgi:hypothetical protein